MNRILSFLTGIFLFSVFLNAQESFVTQKHGFVHGNSPVYEYPADSAVLAKLDRWRDLKFGVMFHWGVYSVKGISESWALCSEDRWFTQRRREARPDLNNYGQFKDWYWSLADSLNPVSFDPYVWADHMEKAGCKYLVFTTKHHDGFCMFDSGYTDYSIANGPYAGGKYSNAAYYVFDAFRRHGFMIGAYFSKPDWHNADYWDPFFATPTRNPNYDISKYPEKWEKFRGFVADQIDELMSDYGSIDILWLDGGWVRKPQQDIGIDGIVDRAREKQPGLIAVDRTVPGRNENYQTPELTIPKEQRDYPWESCISLGDSWGWSAVPNYKSSRSVINILAEIVAKGGNLLLNIGPRGDGTIDEEAYEIMAEVGDWLDRNGKAIYSTRPVPVYNDGRIWFTAAKDKKTLYAIYTLPENESLPEYIEWEGNVPAGKMTLLSNGQRVKYSVNDGKVRVFLPESLPENSFALEFRARP